MRYEMKVTSLIFYIIYDTISISNFIQHLIQTFSKHENKRFFIIAKENPQQQIQKKKILIFTHVNPPSKIQMRMFAHHQIIEKETKLFSTSLCKCRSEMDSTIWRFYGTTIHINKRKSVKYMENTRKTQGKTFKYRQTREIFARH